MKRLPLQEFVPHRRTNVLNVDTVIAILVSYIKSNDWSVALGDNIPQRFVTNTGLKRKYEDNSKYLNHDINQDQI